MHRLLGLFLGFTSCRIGLRAGDAQDKSLTVFAAASMKNALDDIDAAYTRKPASRSWELCRTLGTGKAIEQARRRMFSHPPIPPGWTMRSEKRKYQ